MVEKMLAILCNVPLSPLAALELADEMKDA